MSMESFQTNREISESNDTRPLNTINQIKEALEEGVVLSEKEAAKLFDSHDGDKLFLIQHVNQFKNLDQNTVIIKMLHEGRKQWILDNFDKFDNLDEETKELVYEKFNPKEQVA